MTGLAAQMVVSCPGMGAKSLLGLLLARPVLSLVVGGGRISCFPQFREKQHERSEHRRITNRQSSKRRKERKHMHPTHTYRRHGLFPGTPPLRLRCFMLAWRNESSLRDSPQNPRAAADAEKKPGNFNACVPNDVFRLQPPADHHPAFK